MKKIACTSLILILLVIMGCVAEVKGIKPEIVNNTFMSNFPVVNISMNPRFTYLGKVSGGRVSFVAEGYVFGVVKDFMIEEAVIMVYDTVDYSEFTHITTGSPKNVYKEMGGYKWIPFGGVLNTLEKRFGWETDFKGGSYFKEAYVINYFQYIAARNTTMFTVYYISCIVYDSDFHKWEKCLKNNWNRDYLTAEQQSELDNFASHFRDAFEIKKR